MFDFASHDFWTGGDIMPLFPSACSWTTRITGTGRADFTFQLRDSLTALPRDEMRRVLKPRARMISVADGNDVAYAGVIMRSVYDRARGAVTVSTAQFRTVYSWRMTAGVNIAPPGGTLAASGLSASGAVRRIMQRAQQWSPDWTVPADLPADGTGNIAIDAQWYDWIYAEDMIQDVEDRGYEFYNPAYFKGDGSLWHGTLVAPQIVTGTTDLALSAFASPAVGETYTIDAQDQVTGVIARGNGSGSDMLTAWAGEPTAEGIPIVDIGVDPKDVHDIPSLQQIADATFAERRKAVTQWSTGVVLGDDLKLADVMPGRVAEMDIYGDEWIPDGTTSQRVIALSGGMTETVTPEVQPHGS